MEDLKIIIEEDFNKMNTSNVLNIAKKELRNYMKNDEFI